MKLLLFTICTIALLSTVDCSKVSCDSQLNNVTCFQNSCSQQPCSMLCGVGSIYQRCVQKCNESTCDMNCLNHMTDDCHQQCPGGVCGLLSCDAKRCTQLCSDGNCTSMLCRHSPSSCVQTSGKDMVCASERCEQNCPGGKCNMTCTRAVKVCVQSCTGGGVCFYKCDADNCTLDCNGGQCTNINPPVTTKPSDPRSTGVRFLASHVFGLLFALFVIVQKAIQ